MHAPYQPATSLPLLVIHTQVWDAVAQRIPERARWIEELASGAGRSSISCLAVHRPQTVDDY
jgi:hypothetical protein